MEKSSSTSTLPLPIKLDILLKLPTKSLCRFRCVSKSWSALISHPKFVKIHRSQPGRHGLALVSYNSKSLYTMDIKTLSCSNKLVAVKDGFSTRILDNQEFEFLPVGGSCNGLICIRLTRSLLFYNPSTKESKQIEEFGARYHIYGLGYVESIDDYKYVKICEHEKPTYVYSLKKDTWTGVENDYHFMTGQASGIPLNGALYWMGYQHPSRVMVSFDLAEEKFKTLPLPDIMVQDYHHSFTLGLLGGFLCVFMGDKRCKVDLWIMYEYGLKESWTKVWTIKGHDYIHTLCCSETILARMDFRQVMLWDPKDAELKKIEVECIDKLELNPFVYVESLVSPHYRNHLADEVDLSGYILE